MACASLGNCSVLTNTFRWIPKVLDSLRRVFEELRDLFPSLGAIKELAGDVTHRPGQVSQASCGGSSCTSTSSLDGRSDRP